LFRQNCKVANHSSFERRQIVDDGSPNGVQINPLIRMAKLVSDATDIPPRLIGYTFFRFLSESDGGLADDL
jgi:hypothetical protein